MGKGATHEAAPELRRIVKAKHWNRNDTHINRRPPTLKGMQLCNHPFLTREEVACLLKVDGRVVGEMVERGDLPYLDLTPRVRRFRLNDVQQALTQKCLVETRNAERGTRNAES